MIKKCRKSTCRENANYKWLLAYTVKNACKIEKKKSRLNVNLTRIGLNTIDCDSSSLFYRLFPYYENNSS